MVPCLYTLAAIGFYATTPALRGSALTAVRAVRPQLQINLARRPPRIFNRSWPPSVAAADRAISGGAAELVGGRRSQPGLQGERLTDGRAILHATLFARYVERLHGQIAAIPPLAARGRDVAILNCTRVRVANLLGRFAVGVRRRVASGSLHTARITRGRSL